MFTMSVAEDIAKQGKARQGKARQGKAKQGKTRQSKARQGKARHEAQTWTVRYGQGCLSTHSSLAKD